MAESENVITKTSDFIRWFLPKADKMPRNFKFLFGDRIVKIQIDLLERLIEAYYGRDKLKPLLTANIEVEKLRQLLRVSADLQWMSVQQFEFATRQLNEIGSMIGGWQRHLRVAKADGPQ